MIVRIWRWICRFGGMSAYVCTIVRIPCLDGRDRVRQTTDMNDRASDLADAVRRRRRELKLTQVDVAELAGCSPRFVHMVEHAKDTVRLDKLLDVLVVLGLELHVVRGRRGLLDLSRRNP